MRIVSYRETTEETSYRVEVRRAMSETLTGAVSYVYSDRDGSPFITTTQASGALGSNLIAPLHLADRKRDKMACRRTGRRRPLTIQFFVDWADDATAVATGRDWAPERGGAQLFAGCGLHLLEKWQGNAW